MTIFEFAAAHPTEVICLLLLIVGVTVGLFARGELRTYAASTVAAIYRAALVAAKDFANDQGQGGLSWLLSEDGVAFRKSLIDKAYDNFPAKIVGIPAGVFKAVISREQFHSLVERKFQKVVRQAKILLAKER